MSPIGERVRTARLALGLSKAQLASRTGLSTSYLTQLESEDGSATIKSPGPDKLGALAAGLGTTMEHLAFGSGAAPRKKPKQRRKAS